MTFKRMILLINSSIIGDIIMQREMSMSSALSLHNYVVCQW